MALPDPLPLPIDWPEPRGRSRYALRNSREFGPTRDQKAAKVDGYAAFIFGQLITQCPPYVDDRLEYWWKSGWREAKRERRRPVRKPGS